MRSFDCLCVPSRVHHHQVRSTDCGESRCEQGLHTGGHTRLCTRARMALHTSARVLFCIGGHAEHQKTREDAAASMHARGRGGGEDGGAAAGRRLGALGGGLLLALGPRASRLDEFLLAVLALQSVVPTFSLVAPPNPGSPPARCRRRRGPRPWPCAAVRWPPSRAQPRRHDAATAVGADSTRASGSPARSGLHLADVAGVSTMDWPARRRRDRRRLRPRRPCASEASIRLEVWRRAQRAKDS